VNDLKFNTKTAMSIYRNCLVVTIQGELYDDLLSRMRTDILEKIQATKARGLVLDFSTVRMLDSFTFNSFADIAKMASLLGATTVFVGLQPGVVSTLVDLSVEIIGVETALTIEDAFEQLHEIASIHDKPEDTKETDNFIIEEHDWENDSGKE
jgi:rsbT antagonist protein RsbS